MSWDWREPETFVDAGFQTCDSNQYHYAQIPFALIETKFVHWDEIGIEEMHWVGIESMHFYKFCRDKRKWELGIRQRGRILKSRNLSPFTLIFIVKLLTHEGRTKQWSRGCRVESVSQCSDSAKRPTVKFARFFSRIIIYCTVYTMTLLSSIYIKRNNKNRI